MRDDLKNRIDAHVVNNHTTNHDDLSFANKMKNLFSGDSNPSKDMKEKLGSLGVTDKQIERYMSDIASGDIIIVVNNQKRVGTDAADSTIRLRSPIIKRLPMITIF
ncbi:hypothetical protein ABRT01_14485 [Lentibacillus sp. L22]|uniref:hypothetical protein n=1 Tax=Lentibacillus TaxID=175304 RepID=UPI003466B1EC